MKMAKSEQVFKAGKPAAAVCAAGGGRKGIDLPAAAVGLRKTESTEL